MNSFHVNCHVNSFLQDSSSFVSRGQVTSVPDRRAENVPPIEWDNLSAGAESHGCKPERECDLLGKERAKGSMNWKV